MAVVYLGLGSNIGDRFLYIQAALKLLEKNNIRVKKLSRLIETDPVGGPKQNKFLNAAAQVETALLPKELLNRLKMIENSLGRTREVRYGPRTIDIDILLYDRLVRSDPDLKIPHPLTFERDFVMTPLKEIAPHLFEGLKYLQPRNPDRIEGSSRHANHPKR